MKKFILFLICSSLLLGNIFAQSDDEIFGYASDDELFGGFGGDDGFFFDDTIEEYTDVSAKTDLSKGNIFDNGSVKVGGSLSAGISTMTTLYADDDKNFGDHIYDTTFSPSLSAMLSVDARPTEVLRMYTKFGFAYPFNSTAISTAQTTSKLLLAPDGKSGTVTSKTNVNTKITDYLKLKEIFTDFSIADTAFFRFGIHTVTWGTGYFYSPVSDMINTSSINPEDPTAQVDGSLNLRTQIIFPGTQNCLWLYVIPSTDFTQGTSSYLRDTSLAAKADIMINNFELGVGAFWKYQSAPKLMLTGTGSLKKVTFFGEAVYQYGAASEWEKNTKWDNKKSIIQATFGLSYYWKDPAITLAAQVYYDGNDVDLEHKYLTYGHNIAAMVNFGKILGNTDFSASIFAMANIGKDELPPVLKTMLGDASSFINAFTGSAMLNYNGLSNMSFGLGPYITWSDFDEPPVVSLKLSATLGGGRF